MTREKVQEWLGRRRRNDEGEISGMTREGNVAVIGGGVKGGMYGEKAKDGRLE